MKGVGALSMLLMMTVVGGCGLALGSGLQSALGLTVKHGAQAVVAQVQPSTAFKF